MRRSMLVPLGLFVAACSSVSRVPTPAFAPQPTSALEVIDYPPPPARVETVPPRPATGAVWIDGEWIARHHHWGWLAGRWVLTPKGARYSPWTVVRGPDGTLYAAPGVWRDAQGRPIDPPPALATAGVESAGVVVDPEGDTEGTGRTIRRAPPPRMPTGPEPR